MNIFKNILKNKFSTFLYFFEYLRFKLILIIILSIIVSLLDSVGLAMFLPLIQLVGGDGTVSSEKLGDFKIIGDIFNSVGLELNLLSILVILIIFFLLKGLFVYISSVSVAYIIQDFVSKIRIELTDLFSKYSYKNFVSTDLGRAQNSFTEEIGRISNALKSYTDCIQQAIMVAVYTLLVFNIDFKFALFTVIGGLLTNGIFSGILNKTKKESSKLTENNSAFQGLIIQYITNFKYLKTTGTLSQYATKLKNRIKLVEKNYKKIGLYNSIVASAREPILMVVTCVIILIQVNLLGGALATIMISLLFFYRALGALVLFQNSYNNFLSFSGSLANIKDMQMTLKAGEETNSTKEFIELKYAINLNKVSFGYHEDSLILKNISLNIEKNKTIAFVGSSGSGKTTLISLLSGLLVPSSGNLFIDDKNIIDIDKKTYQNKIGYISQDPVVFNDSIFNNITFWDEPNDVNRKRFFNSIEQAAIADFILDLKDKEHTILGNNGINLSGGQKQRMSIARELYKNIDILILDEATSALDTQTEREIQMNIDKLKGSCTILIIAHRLSTIKNADIICLMENGEIIAKGNFSELIDKSAKFQKMVELQEI
ncbi:MAG: ABC transporter ATP-binding protein [Chitinophagales bacterium]